MDYFMQKARQSRQQTYTEASGVESGSSLSSDEEGEESFSFEGGEENEGEEEESGFFWKAP